MVALHQIAGGKAEAMEFIADDTARVTGVPLTDLNLKRGILVACVSRGQRTEIARGDTVIHSGDSVVVVCRAGHQIYDINDILIS
jgi:trk system potassium uptake protein TrkA